ncbi:Holliday junction resolvase RuvX [Alicyclobacillus sp. SO9]|uniref:Holliday junction resolvase RuvX n=1 Tax=Alicyclobacillus sp. SO9 TaxID=2665646 RepID=UPI0018E79667|nr:Holliday junction resolvase RuvX [Alicyclobacillus sp. SO9]QQE81342.1 Holliday junction resolvase RuvX [Alicyclobacillus sp. SO9]
MQNTPKRILAIDYGLARIGLAKSDAMGILAQTYGVIRRRSDNQAIEDILQVVQAEQVTEIVVGLPKNMDGSLGERALQCQQFADVLRAKSQLPVEMYDERLTTVSAERVLIEADMSRKKRRKVVDAVAATVLLQSYLDAAAHK